MEPSWKKILKTCQQVSCVTFAFSIPILPFVSGKFLVLSLLISIPSFEFKTTLRKLWSQAWDILLYIAILSIGLIYSTNFREGLGALETKSSLLGIALLFSILTTSNPISRDKIFKAFLYGTIVASVICLGKAVFSYYSENNIDVFFFYNFTEVINSHPTYFAYYIIFTIVFCLHRMYVSESREKLINSIAIIYLSIILMLTGGATSYVSVLIIASFFITKFFTDKRKSVNGSSVFITSILLIGTLFLFSGIDSQKQDRTDYWERFTLWESAIKATHNPLFGVGTGDYKTEITKYYVEHGYTQYAISGFNAHNQFIQVYFANGILGVIALLIMLTRPLYLSIKNKSSLGFLVFFSFLIYGVTEVFLGRYQGVVFFAMLHQAFISHFKQQSQQISLKPM